MIDVYAMNNFSFINDDIEIKSCKIKIGHNNCIISVIYRPHSKHIAVNEFTTLLDNLLNNETFRNIQ